MFGFFSRKDKDEDQEYLCPRCRNYTLTLADPENTKIQYCTAPGCGAVVRKK